MTRPLRSYRDPVVAVPGEEGELGHDGPLRRTLDLAVAALGLLLCAPVLAAIALLVKSTSPGPVLYKQVRVGRHGRSFLIWKFRTMGVGADQQGPAVSGVVDERVTPFGRWLRRTRLDELPQLVNLARGQVTLVGPRPEVPTFVEYYTADERRTLSVRPGVLGAGALGWAGPLSRRMDEAEDPERWYAGVGLHEKLAMEMEYLRNRCLRRDAAIVWATLHLVAREGIGR